MPKAMLYTTGCNPREGGWIEIEVHPEVCSVLKVTTAGRAFLTHGVLFYGGAGTEL